MNDKEIVEAAEQVLEMLDDMYRLIGVKSVSTQASRLRAAVEAAKAEEAGSGRYELSDSWSAGGIVDGNIQNGLTLDEAITMARDGITSYRSSTREKLDSLSINIRRMGMD